MTPELTPSSEFAPLPVRRRETLDIFDTSLKLYRRYFWVLMGWSAIVAVCSIIPVASVVLFLLASPLLYGAVSCCIAAAVRGQRVKFKQCWQFTKPRYGAMLGITFLSWIVFFGFIMVLYIASVVIGLVGVLALSNAPEPVQVVMGVVGVIVLLVLLSGLGALAFGWMNMVPIVACLEDDKRGTAAMGRALELLKGNWRRVFGLCLILGLAIIAVMGIVGGAFFLFSNGSVDQILGTSLIYSFGLFMSLFYVVWNPAQFIVIAVLYLDLRVRREALDLEWTAYASAPPAAPQDRFAAPAPGQLPANQLPADQLPPLQTPSSQVAFGVSSFAQEAVRPSVEPETIAPVVEVIPVEMGSPVESTQTAPPTSLPTFESSFAPTPALTSVVETTPPSAFESSFAPSSGPVPSSAPVVGTPASEIFHSIFDVDADPETLPPNQAESTGVVEVEAPPTSFAPTSVASTSVAPTSFAPTSFNPAPFDPTPFDPTSFAPSTLPDVTPQENRESDGSSG